MCLHNTERGAATERRDNTLAAEDTPTQWLNGAAATQRLANTLPSEDAPTPYLKKGQQPHGAWPAHYPQSSRSSAQPTIEAADHQTSPSADPHGT